MIDVKERKSVSLLESVSGDEVNRPLYEGAPVMAKFYHKQLFEFANSVRLDVKAMNKLLKLIDSALPHPNNLVKSYKKLTSIFQLSSSFLETTVCVICSNIIDLNNHCSYTCQQNELERRVGDIIEFVSMDQSKKQLVDVIRRNKHLIIDYPRLVDETLPCDIMTRSIYRKKRKNKQLLLDQRYPVTLMLHIDGFPVVHWTKKHTWLVTGSIIEIPPCLRENQINMLLISLW